MKHIQKVKAKKEPSSFAQKNNKISTEKFLCTFFICYNLVMKIRKIIKRLFKLIAIGVFIAMIYAVGVSTFEYLLKNKKLNEFKSRAYETETIRHYDKTYHYHKVRRTSTYELSDTRSVFYDEARVEPGQKGDILLTYGSPFPYIPVLDPFVSFMFGGHVSFVSDNNQIIESTGIGSSGLLDFNLIWNVVNHKGYDETDEYGVSIQKTYNYWMVPYRTEINAEYPYYGEFFRDEFYAVRPKVEDIKQLDSIINASVDFAEDKVDKALYNYLFAFDTKYKFYCSDLVSRAYQSINNDLNTNYNLNQDGFVTTVGDILLSDDVYITIYHETIKNEIHIYYLEDIV